MKQPTIEFCVHRSAMASTSTVPQSVGEKRVVFHHLNWQAYQQILQALGEHRSAHLTYDREILEITIPLEDHEFATELIGRFIYFLVVEMHLKIKSLRSTTLEREDLDRNKSFTTFSVRRSKMK